MAITDKTKEILWTRSGNRCAVCRRELIIDAAAADDESAVGDECHIVSGRPHGPRFDEQFPSNRIDDADNWSSQDLVDMSRRVERMTASSRPYGPLSF